MPASDWYQQVLTPPDVFEVRIRLGVVPETDHAQCLVEIFDPVTGVQMGMKSCPHDSIANVAGLLRWAQYVAVEWVDERVEPF